MKEIKLPKFYFTFQTFWLRFVGIELMIKDESFRYKIYSAIALVFTGTFAFVECIEVIFHRDFDTLVVVCNYAVSHFLGMIKVVFMYRNRKQIGDLIQSLHEGVYKPNDERGGAFEKKCVKKVLRRVNILMFCYGMSMVIVYSLGLTTSLKIRLTQPPELWKLSFAPISLVDITYSPAFEITYVYQAIGIFMITVCVYSCDITVISIIAQVGAQLKILEKAVRNYESRGLKNQAENRSLPVEDALIETLNRTIDHHLNILETFDTVEFLCSYLVLCVFIANLILLCLLMYYTSLMPLNSLEFMQYLFYCFLIAIQVFLYCWEGNEMTLANEALADGIAETYTPYEPISHAKALKLMMIRSQRPLYFTAGKFVPLSLETYKGIIKGSFSYFMVLRQVNGEAN